MKQTIRITKATKEKLVAFSLLYERETFLNGDPSWFMHQVEGKENQEVMAFMAACLSYGARTQFMPRITYLLEAAKQEPYSWVKNKCFLDEIPDNSACFYRLYSNQMMRHFFSALSEMLSQYGSISGYIKAFASKDNSLLEGKIRAIVAIEALCMFFSERKIEGIIPKNTKSSCKRLCMFLRWLVRENSPVDLGIWCDFIDKKTLIIPLDTHVVKQANYLKLIDTTSATMSVARRLTDALLRVFPDDPLKGDFALFGYGVKHNTF